MDTSIFESHIIHCPICKTEQSQVELKSSSHVIVKKEQNGMPIEINWYDESNSSINILYYYFWTCRSCSYTDKITNFFKAESALSEHLKNYRRTFKELTRSSNSFLTASTSTINSHNSQDYEKSLLQLFVYLFVLTKMPENAEVNYIIGDIYLRTSWVLHHNSIEIPNSESTKAHTRDFDEILSENFNSYLQSFKKFEIDIISFKKETVNLLHKSVTDDNKESLKEHYKHLKGFNSNLDKTLAYLNLLNTKFSENTKSIEKLGSEHDVGKEKTFESLLNELRKYWIDIPTSEKSALLSSNEYYRKSVSLGYFGNNVQGICNLFKIIIFTYDKLDSYGDLKEFLDGGLKLLYNLFKTFKADVNGLEEKREKLKKRIDSINTDQLSSTSVLVESLAELDSIIQQKKTNMRAIRDYSGKFKTIRDRAKETLVSEELDLIHTLIEDKNIASQDQAKKYLLTQNISPDVIEQYFKAGAPKKEKQKKSSLMGFLKGF